MFVRYIPSYIKKNNHIPQIWQYLISFVIGCFKPGEHNLRTSDGFEQEVVIKRFFKHPRYNVTCRYNYDLALLKLNRTLKYSNRVGPVCLPDSEFTSGSICHVAGWGTTGLGAERLSKVQLNSFPRPCTKCKYGGPHGRRPGRVALLIVTLVSFDVLF